MINDIHIGKMIREKMNEKRRPVVWLAGELCCSRENVYKLLEKSNIDIKRLDKIGDSLNHNFFKDLYNFSINESKQ